jgi:glycosyltransferase involved in cell wall biosynthesis
VTDPVVPQHLVLVLPSTGEFDSRSYRIARACIARGHRVTMVARWKDGLAFEEAHPVGFRLLRIRVSAQDGMPLKGLVRAGRVVVRRIHAWRTRTPYRPPEVPREDDIAPPPPPVAGSTSAVRAGSADSPAVTARRVPVHRRLWAELQRRIAIPLTIRSHRRNAARLVPAGDLYHGMAYMGIPVALELGRRDRVPVVYDARDIYLEARNMARMGRPARWFLGRFERGWAKAARRVITVNEAYAGVMASRWPVERPLVVMNCSFRYTPSEPRRRLFHERLGLDPAEKVVLYHGGFFPWRGIEQLIEAIPLVAGATLVLMGYGILEPTLRAWEADPALHGKVRVMAAVPPDELHDWVAAADVAAMPIQGDTLNHRLTTPNKLFEAMAAGVPAVVSDLPGMRAVVREADSGILVDPTDTAAIAAAIRRIVELPDDEWQAWRARCLAAAHHTYNWETQVEKLLATYSALTGKRW